MKGTIGKVSWKDPLRSFAGFTSWRFMKDSFVELEAKDRADGRVTIVHTIDQIRAALAHRRNPVVTDNRPALEFLGFEPAYPQLQEHNPREWTRRVELDPRTGWRRLAIERVLLLA